MSERPWLCEAPHGTEFQLPFLPCLRDDRAKFMSHLQAIQPLQQANDIGAPFDPDLISDRLFWGRKGSFDGALPPIFHNAFTYLRRDVAEVVRRHELGQGCLRPIELIQNDTITPIGQTAYAIVVGNAIETLDSTASDLDVHPNQKDRFILPLSTRGKTFVVRPDFEAAVDIWADPRVSEGFFLSERLVRALTHVATPKELALVPVS